MTPLVYLSSKRRGHAKSNRPRGHFKGGRSSKGKQAKGVGPTVRGGTNEYGEPRNVVDLKKHGLEFKINTHPKKKGSAM